MEICHFFTILDILISLVIHHEVYISKFHDFDVDHDNNITNDGQIIYLLLVYVCRVNITSAPSVMWVSYKITLSHFLQTTIINGGMCPQIFPSSATGEYLIHVNYNYQQNPLRINSSHLNQFRDDFNNNRFQ